MSLRSFSSAGFWFCLAGLLSACGGVTVKETLGIDQKAPDEFRVLARPPLSVPPQFDLPQPGATRQTDVPEPRAKAHSLILGTSKGGAKKSAAESVFLEKAGAAKANPNIKKELNESRIQQQIEKEQADWWEGIAPPEENKEPVVKAVDEAKRIQDNKAAGKSITEGETPEVEGGMISTLEHWLGEW